MSPSSGGHGTLASAAVHVNESVNSVGGGGHRWTETPQLSTSSFQKNRSGAWGGVDNSVQGLGEGDSAPFPAEGKVTGGSPEVWVGHKALELEP